MDQDLVKFKGFKEGLQIILDPDATFEELIERLEDKMKVAGSFFSRGNISAIIQGRDLTEDQYLIIKTTLWERFNIPLHENPVTPMEETNFNAERRPSKTKLTTNLDFTEATKNDTLYIRKTIRSGQRMDLPCNVVLIGDVNPGAIITARGNIIVLGRLSGVVHAGLGGDYDAFIAASVLQPTQIRINDLISRAPEDENKPSGPEIARVIDGHIYIEPYI
jgi:septum site-determining protein MinC